MTIAIVVFVGISLVHAAYRTVETRWPDNYMALAAGPDYEISRRLHRYLLFRLIPIVVVGAFAGSVLGEEHDPVILPALAIGAIHWAFTSGRALAEIRQRQGLSRQPLVSFVHFLVLPLLCVASVLSAVLGTQAGRAIPAPGEVVAGLWTGVLAAVMAVFLLRVTGASDPDHARIFRESRDEVSSEVWEHAASASIDRRLDPTLTQAILIVENVQRPSWFRRLESLAGRLFRSGSYGIMQAHADKPLSDAESIDHVLDGVLSQQGEIRAEGYPDHNKIDAIAHQYNPSDQYAESVVNAYMWLEHDQDDYSKQHRERSDKRSAILKLYEERLAATHDRVTSGLPRLAVTSELWCREVPQERMFTCHLPIHESFVRT